MDSKRTRGKKFTGKDEKMITNFKDYIIKESIIDIPRRTYAPAVFDNADTKKPTIKRFFLILE